MDGVWQPLPSLATLHASQENGETQTGTPQAGNAPRLRAWSRCGYFTAEMNTRHALAGTLSVPLPRFLVSRTITELAVVATSTHSPPLAPE
jgi:hypothetical protein